MPQASQPIEATRPDISASVLASAGTGKTWMLVTRIVRLLLDGQEPGGILAITFTRKAAAEMQSRLRERLESFLFMDDETLAATLRTMGMNDSPDLRQRARGLFERLLLAEHGVRTHTFHGFCQEVLTRFPLEAGIAADFELVTDTGLLFDEAWQALDAEATARPDSSLAAALDELFTGMGGIDSVRQALSRFIDNRNEWWMWTRDQADPPDFASRRLAALLDPPADRKTLLNTLLDDRATDLKRFAELLARHQTRTNLEHCTDILQALDTGQDLDLRFESLQRVFLTAQGEPRARGHSKALEKALGADGVEEMLALHATLSQAILDARRRLHHQLIHRVSSAWYHCGHHLLTLFQRLKAEQGVMDFTDLEWHAYRLLSSSDHAHWIQYKLDQRIDHLLIDEFQDTNPVQWYMLRPLIDEMPYRENERSGTLFIVGDGKQSIYGFRRAEPRLLDVASQHLGQTFNALTVSMNNSWRSSPAVIEAVNRVFDGNPLIHFERHATHHKDLWGRVEVWPPFRKANDDRTGLTGLRNPLRQPRPSPPASAVRLEAEAVASRIRQLVDDKTPVERNGAARPLAYSDIFILLRKRTHMHEFEQALRRNEIPYVSSGRGTLLDSLEIRDMEALLRFLITPYNNLELAQILKSPLFACGDEDLFALAQASDQGNWFERLQWLVANGTASQALQRAHDRLLDWMQAAGHIPVHDLLDRIYHEGDVVSRYLAVVPEARRPSIPANLGRFIELALEVDAGRYPSLTRFLHRLRALRQHADDAPDEPPQGTGLARVQILTVHAAKGLEAPVVFVADCGKHRAPSKGWECLIDWPPDSDRPANFLLCDSIDENDPRLGGIRKSRQTREQIEDANLLYVAMTRARQYLFLSGSANGKDDDGWLHRVRTRLGDDAKDKHSVWIIEHATPPIAHPSALASAEDAVSVTHDATPPGQADDPDQPVLPSGTIHETRLRYHDMFGREKGIVMHKILELITREANPDRDAILRLVRLRHAHGLDETAIETLYEQAVAVTRMPELAAIFDPGKYRQAWNEVAIQYLDDTGRPVTGVIDRLVDTGNGMIVIDYKNHTGLDSATIDNLVTDYEQQMRLYMRGVEKLRPDTGVSGLLVFTSSLEVRPVTPD